MEVSPRIRPGVRLAFAPGQPDRSVSAPDSLSAPLPRPASRRRGTPPPRPPAPAPSSQTRSPPSRPTSPGPASTSARCVAGRSRSRSRAPTGSTASSSPPRCGGARRRSSTTRRRRCSSAAPTTTTGALVRRPAARRRPHGDPVVIDWRAECRGPSTGPAAPSRFGVVRRRRFGIEPAGSPPTRTSTSTRTRRASDDAAQRRSWPARSSDPASGRCATSWRRSSPSRTRSSAPRRPTVCVQGAPGTGKTAVGLHRAAWLLYAHREQLGRAGVLVVGPNASFLDHVGRRAARARRDRGPAHDRRGDGPARTARSAATDDVAVAALKGDARMAEVVRRAVWSHVATPAEALVLPRGARRWRVPAYEVGGDRR